MGVEYIPVLMPKHTCDVCGKEGLPALVIANQDLVPEVREEGPAPEVKIVLCMEHSGTFNG